MDVSRARVLLILSQEVLDRARVFAGRATTSLKLPVSLQIVLRALIEEGLRRGDDGALLRNVERQAHAVREIRSAARRADRGEGALAHRAPGHGLRRMADGGGTPRRRRRPEPGRTT